MSGNFGKLLGLGLAAARLLAVEPVAPVAPARLKEVASFEGVRDNQLLGYGLVVGLAGTGDKRQTVFSAQSLANMLQRMGVAVQPTAMLVRNMAAVMVTANLPPYAQPGIRIDVTVAAIGDAPTLQGGLLVICPLKAADGQVYAVAQGPLVTGGFVAGRGGTTQTTNHPTTARIPDGAIVERRSPSPEPGRKLRLQLHRADFTTAVRIAKAINGKFGAPNSSVARAENAALVTIEAPAEYATRPAEFVAEIESLTVVADRRARIVVNERSGSIVLGREVRIAPVTILHGSLTVEVETGYAVSQPPPLSSGETKVVPQVGVGVKEEPARNISLKQGATVEDLVRGLKKINSTPREVIAILETLRAAGALDADLEVI
jgi:flagellar P-ring protein precursor FlgI